MITLALAAALFGAGHPGPLDTDEIVVDGVTRRFAYYIPDGAPAAAPVILAFHGSNGSAERLRNFLGGALERLADERGFVAIYPEGYEGNWNGCRRRSPSSANRLDIDDVVFARGLVDWLTARRETPPVAVFALGLSGGGHMALRLALEVPELVSAAAVFGASLPVAGEIDCSPSERPVSVLLMNGTADPVSPYAGGDVVAPDGVRLGTVRSSRATAEYFAELAGYSRDASRRLTVVERDMEGRGVELTAWEGRHGAVRLYTAWGGGHTVPGPRTRVPEIVGPTERRFDGITASVSFLLMHAE